LDANSFSIEWTPESFSNKTILRYSLNILTNINADHLLRNGNLTTECGLTNT